LLFFTELKRAIQIQIKTWQQENNLTIALNCTKRIGYKMILS